MIPLKGTVDLRLDPGTMYRTNASGEDPYPLTEVGSKLSSRHRLQSSNGDGRIPPNTIMTIISEPWRTLIYSHQIRMHDDYTAINVLTPDGPYTILAHWLNPKMMVEL